MKTKLTAILLCLPIFLCFITYANAKSYSYTAAEVDDFVGGIVAYKSGGNAQQMIDGVLCDEAGVSAEFYIIALSQLSEYDFSRYENALLSYLQENEVYSAASREKYALALAAVGSTNGYIEKTADEAIGGQGLMSLIFGLHLLNNGYSSNSYSVNSLINEILSYQLSDGGWAVIGSNSDVDVTAMAVQALAPNLNRSDVSFAVDSALELLSERQLSSGGYKSMGAENSESSAQVLTALSALGIDAQYDSRFIKDGNTVLSALLSYKNEDGSFAHTGSGYNETATCQAMYAMVSYLRYLRGDSSLYVLDKAVLPQYSSNGYSSQIYSGNNVADSDEENISNDNGNQQTAEQGSSKGSSKKAESAQAKDEAAEAKTNATASTKTAASEAPSYGGFQAEATADMATADEVNSSQGNYKIYVISGIVLLAFGAWLVLFLRGKRSKKHIIAIAVLAAVGILLVLVTNISSTDTYAKVEEADTDSTVTVTIRCDTIVGKEKVNSHIPDDGIILDTTVMGISEGDTVYDVLLRCAKIHSVQLDNKGTDGSAYIAGINYLYEFDYGDLSGWMYRLNGEFPDVGCQSCYLSDGDTIEWLYTTNIGKDL